MKTQRCIKVVGLVWVLNYKLTPKPQFLFQSQYEYKQKRKITLYVILTNKIKNTS